MNFLSLQEKQRNFRKIVRRALGYFYGKFMTWCISTLGQLFLEKDRSSIEKSGKVLVIRLDRIGDFVIFTAVLKYFRRIYPNAQITFVCSPPVAELARACPYIDEVRIWRRRKYARNPFYRFSFLRKIHECGFDVAIYPVYLWEHYGDEMIRFSGALERIGFEGEKLRFKNNSFYTLLVKVDDRWNPEIDKNRQFIESFGIRVAFPLETGVWLTDEDKQFAQSFLAENHVNLAEDKIVAICPGASWIGKAWPVNQYAKLADALMDNYDVQVLICGGPGEENLAEDMKGLMHNTPIISSGKTTLRQLAAILSHCCLYIGNDTGTLHIAVAVKIPTVCIIGGGHFGRFFPYGDLTKNRIVYKKMDCYRCNWRCIYDTVRCIQEIEFEDVWRGVELLLQSIASKKKLTKKESVKGIAHANCSL